MSDSLRDALAGLIAAEDELHAARARVTYLDTLPFTRAVAESGLTFPLEGAYIDEKAAFGEAVYRPSRERLRAATEARAVAMQQARAVLEAFDTGAA